MHTCPGCFEQLDTLGSCPNCNCGEPARRSPLFLPLGTILRGQYVIGNVLGNPGGFGITYLGYNQKLECRVAIKEYVPKEIAGRGANGVAIEVHAENDAKAFRQGLDRFLQEARLLAKFNHPNIVRVVDFFEENGTAYLVMDYYSGVNLVEYLEQKGALSEQNALCIILPIMDGLQEVHALGILHRDIKPRNIYLTSAGRPILLDFGAARQAFGELTQSLSLVLTPGFAPFEQYHKRGMQGPWTDVYGCAATLFYMLTRSVPPDAISRMSNDTLLPLGSVSSLSHGTRQALEWGLALLPENRPQSIGKFQAALSGSTVKLAGNTLTLTQPSSNWAPAFPASDTASIQTAEIRQPLPEKEKSSLRRAWKLAAAVVIMLLLVGSGFWYYRYMIDPSTQLAKKGIAFTEQAFFQAIKTDDQDAVMLFLRSGYKPDHLAEATGETPLIKAIEAGQYPMVKLLITQGASLDQKDRQGRLPIEVALRQGNTQILKLLMDQKGLTANSKVTADTSLLEKAMESGNLTTVKFLIEQGADINAKDSSRSTLLDRMIAQGNQQMAVLLKGAGAKRNVNKAFAPGVLNEVKLPAGDVVSFEVDLLGNGIGQQVTLNRQDHFRADAAISQDGRQLATLTKLKEHRWYVVYLRDESVPDLVCLNLSGSDGYIEDFRIIGRTGKDTIGVLYDPDFYARREMRLTGSRSGIQLEGKQLILFSGKNRASVEWNPDSQSFRMRRL